MGQTLSEPVVEKNSRKGADVRLLFGASAMQGWRISMEDSHTTVLDIASDDPRAAGAPSSISFFGVFDGHGGERVALFAGENIHKIVRQQETFRSGEYEQALRDGFLATDREILDDPKYEDEVSGCTACVGLITGDKIFIGNAGDSRCVLGVKGRAKPLSVDHKPQNESEKSRIQAAGGFVEFGRVNGNLALSRAIGDFEFKKSEHLAPESQMVTAFPDVTVHHIGEDDEFLVLACDGIWDCQSSQAVVEFVRRGIAARHELDRICENLMDNCLASNAEGGGIGCDNMTMVIVAFLHGKTKEAWYDDICKRVANGDGPCAPPEYAEIREPGRFSTNLEEEAQVKQYQYQVMTEDGGRIVVSGLLPSAAADDTDTFDDTDSDDNSGKSDGLEKTLGGGAAVASVGRREMTGSRPKGKNGVGGARGRAILVEKSGGATATGPIADEANRRQPPVPRARRVPEPPRPTDILE